MKNCTTIEGARHSRIQPVFQDTLFSRRFRTRRDGRRSGRHPCEGTELLDGIYGVPCIRASKLAARHHPLSPHGVGGKFPRALHRRAAEALYERHRDTRGELGSMIINVIQVQGGSLEVVIVLWGLSLISGLDIDKLTAVLQDVSPSALHAAFGGGAPINAEVQAISAPGTEGGTKSARSIATSGRNRGRRQLRISFLPLLRPRVIAFQS